jgi:hypothetical protein
MNKNKIIKYLIRKNRFEQGKYFKLARKYDRDSEKMQESMKHYEAKIKDFAKNLQAISTIKIIPLNDKAELVISFDLNKLKQNESIESELMKAFDPRSYFQLIKLHNREKLS